jgi:hypothetical protein
MRSPFREIFPCVDGTIRRDFAGKNDQRPSKIWRMRRKFRIARACLSRPTSVLIRQPLAFRAPDRAIAALGIVHAKRGTIAVAEIKFVQVTLQVLLAAMLIRTPHPALEHPEEALNRVGRHVASRIFLRAVFDLFVLGKLPIV